MLNVTSLYPVLEFSDAVGNGSFNSDFAGSCRAFELVAMLGRDDIDSGALGNANLADLRHFLLPGPISETSSSLFCC